MRPNAPFERSTVPPFHRSAGVTLIELLIVLAILGVMASVVSMAVRRVLVPAPDDPFRMLEDSLREAVNHSRPATIRVTVQGVPAFATLNPDGSILADSVLNVPRLSGRVPRAK